MSVQSRVKSGLPKGRRREMDSGHLAWSPLLTSSHLGPQHSSLQKGHKRSPGRYHTFVATPMSRQQSEPARQPLLPRSSADSLDELQPTGQSGSDAAGGARGGPRRDGDSQSMRKAVGRNSFAGTSALALQVSRAVGYEGPHHKAIAEAQYFPLHDCIVLLCRPSASSSCS
jgi:hypothetical protein